MAVEIETSEISDHISNREDYMTWYSPVWLNLIQDSYSNMKNISLIYSASDGEKVYIPFLLSKSKIFGDKIISLPFVDVGGPVGDISIEGIRDCIEFLQKETNVDEISIRFNSIFQNAEKLAKIMEESGLKGGHYKDQLILTLDDKETLWNDIIEKDARTDVRKARKSNLNIKEMKNKKDVKEFYSIYLKTMRRFGTPQQSMDFFLNLWDKLYPDNLRGTICYHEEKPIGAMICYVKNKYVYVAFNVSSIEGREYRPNDFLYWNAIEWSTENNIKYFDFGEAYKNPKTSRERGLTKYKKKWGGDFYPKYQYGTKNKNGGSDMKLAKKIWSMLPLFITKRLGKFLVSRIFH